MKLNFYRPHSLVKQGDNGLGNVHPSLRPSVTTLTNKAFHVTLNQNVEAEPMSL